MLVEKYLETRFIKKWKLKNLEKIHRSKKRDAILARA